MCVTSERTVLLAFEPVSDPVDRHGDNGRKILFHRPRVEARSHPRGESFLEGIRYGVRSDAVFVVSFSSPKAEGAGRE